MTGNKRNIAVIATPTSPILPHLLHALSHEPAFEIIVLTRKTIIEIPFTTSAAHSSSHSHSHEEEIKTPPTAASTNGHRDHDHTSTSVIKHIQTNFSTPHLTAQLRDTHTIICLLHGSDVHLQSDLISLCTSPAIANARFFIPSEYGLDTSNPQIRSLLPPYATRFAVQEKLRSSFTCSGEGGGGGRILRYKAIYCGLCLEESLKADGVLGIDVLWASLSSFPGTSGTKLAISNCADIAGQIVGVVLEDDDDGEMPSGGKGNEIYKSGFRATLDEVVKVVEETLDKPLDRYEADFQGARKEARERMKMGFFDGGVSLMGRVAVWDGGVGTWGAWGEDGSGSEGWEEKVRSAVRDVRGDLVGGAGCGC
ncbi:hypothetical protein LHYA1_G007804 [Lachnellula hyalina]|uniref:Uncharacterized protein n=1 Tax=Lachnellula hyalina TaxID=1316788 RepID=A0A8H8TYQ7_9HELO|nr:uncharacterized protein LHYA1_G007804 [Lachnellula hyalina]TVY24131.1 hypothetical protein LHYA1_G007804 [Lachnellula hyalina]